MGNPKDPLEVAKQIVRINQDAALPPVVVDDTSANPVALVLAIADADGRTAPDGALALRVEGRWLTKHRGRQFSAMALAQVGAAGRQASNWAILHTTQGRCSACKPIALGILNGLASAGHRVGLAGSQTPVENWLGVYRWVQQQCGQTEVQQGYNPIGMATAALLHKCLACPYLASASRLVVQGYSNDETRQVGWIAWLLPARGRVTKLLGSGSVREGK